VVITKLEVGLKTIFKPGLLAGAGLTKTLMMVCWPSWYKQMRIPKGKYEV
jgi:hypothetical protein